MRVDRIAQLYDSPGPYATAIVDVSQDSEDGAQRVELQARAVRDELVDQGAPEDVVETVVARIGENTHRPAPVSRVVVASQSGLLVDETMRTQVPQRVASWSALPDLARWAVYEDSTVPFVLALVDHRGGDVRAYVSDEWSPDSEVEVTNESAHVHKVPGGGWAHLRYQHTSENVWAENAKAVAAEISTHVSRGIRLVLIGGDPRSRSEVEEALGDHAGLTVVELDSGTRNEDGGDEAMAAEISQTLTSAVASRRLERTHTLQDRLGQDYAVAVGVDDVVDAFVRGQVDTLLVDPDAAAEHEVSLDRHPGLTLGAQDVLPPSLRADQVLIAAAALTGAEVAVSRQSTLKGSSAAALLRWDQPDG